MSAKNVGEVKVGDVTVAVLRGALVRDKGSGEVLILGEVTEEDVGRFVLDGRQQEPALNGRAKCWWRRWIG